MALDSLPELLLASSGLNEFLTGLTVEMRRDLERLGIHAHCTLVLLRERRATTVAHSDGSVRSFDAVRYRQAGGACLEAARTGSLVHVEDTARDGRRPDQLPAGSGQGVGSVLAVPLGLDGGAKAALGVHAGHRHAFDEGARRMIRERVRSAAPVLDLAVRLSGHRETETHLSAALESRTAIDLAVGMVMGRNRCCQDEAFWMLATAASNRNVKLRELAENLVTSVGDEPVTTHFDR